MSRLLFPEFLTTQIYLYTNPCRKFVMLMLQILVDFSLEQFFIVFLSLSPILWHFKNTRDFANLIVLFLQTKFMRDSKLNDLFYCLPKMGIQLIN